MAAHSTGLTVESEGREVALNELPRWTEDKIKVFPVVRASFLPFPFRLFLVIPDLTSLVDV